jgi:hypothetical protein
LNESKHWLRRAHKRGLLTIAQTDALKPMLDELAPTLNAFLNSIGPTPPTAPRAVKMELQPTTDN